MKYSWKGHKDRHRHKNRIKRSGQARLVHVKNINRNIPTTWRWAHGDLMPEFWHKASAGLGAETSINWVRKGPPVWLISHPIRDYRTLKNKQTNKRTKKLSVSCKVQQTVKGHHIRRRDFKTERSEQYWLRRARSNSVIDHTHTHLIRKCNKEKANNVESVMQGSAVWLITHLNTDCRTEKRKQYWLPHARFSSMTDHTLEQRPQDWKM